MYFSVSKCKNVSWCTCTIVGLKVLIIYIGLCLNYYNTFLKSTIIIIKMFVFFIFISKYRNCIAVSPKLINVKKLHSTLWKPRKFIPITAMKKYSETR